MLVNACVIWFFVAIARGDDAESKCFSKFDYDERLLMKLVKTEHQIEILNSEKAERKKEFEIEMEEFRQKSAEEIQRQNNLTAVLVQTLNSEKTERMKSFQTKIKEFEIKSAEEIQKQRDITSSFLEMKTEQEKSFESEMEIFKQQRESEIQKQQDLNALLHENLSSEKIKRMRSFEDEMEEFRKENAEEIQNQRNLSAILQTNDTLLNFLGAPVVVFTVSTPADGPSSDAITFTNEIINEGGGFDMATGRFTCPFGGIYYFNLHLMKSSDSSVDQVSCYIKKNGLDTVRAHIDPAGNNGVYGVSNSVYLTLARGDVVTIAGCYTYIHYDKYRYSRYQQMSSANTMESWSSFSGYLVRPHLLIPKDNAGVQ